MDLEKVPQGVAGLTNSRESFILKQVKKKKIWVIASFVFAVILLFTLKKVGFSASSFFSAKPNIDPQTSKKPKYDYMSTFLSRNTEPLGLKENIALKRFLEQPSIKWAIRSGKKHILN
ncbi:MAG: hypothetical protein V3V48_02820 [Candidatus Aminicenantaceae bacterium]|jgi:hypothetical protein